MGSDRKSEEKKKSRKRSFSSASEDEGKGKRHRGVADEDRKSRKSDKKDKKRSHKHSDKEKKTKDKHRSKHRPLNIEIQELSGDDYFSKNNEFSTWLKEEKDVFFSDLSAESARKLFSDFVKAWNKKKLKIKYYEGIQIAPRSAHNWKIKG
ncbi:style cell-cycle inhibitor 1 [Argentina anserina]|uniref:style cell-cycle inhibitor 1 n=1 Tax=Argentina anserina TaxID=57926 RepID=UPI002176853D|nr:style cell-cycle inhibitor 1 [Potentilla anserina]